MLFFGSAAAAAAAAAAASATSSLPTLAMDACAGLVGDKRENGEPVLKLAGLRFPKREAAAIAALVTVRALLKPRTRSEMEVIEVLVLFPWRVLEGIDCAGGGVDFRRRCKKRFVKILTATFFSSSESNARLQQLDTAKSALVQHKPKGKTDEEK